MPASRLRCSQHTDSIVGRYIILLIMICMIKVCSINELCSGTFCHTFPALVRRAEPYIQNCTIVFGTEPENIVDQPECQPVERLYHILYSVLLSGLCRMIFEATSLTIVSMAYCFECHNMSR